MDDLFGLNDEMGGIKIEAVGNHGFWAAPGLYWIANDATPVKTAGLGIPNTFDITKDIFDDHGEKKTFSAWKAFHWHKHWDKETKEFTRESNENCCRLDVEVGKEILIGEIKKARNDFMVKIGAQR
jgi:hypothetical protein